MNPAIAYHERIISKTVLRATDFWGAQSYRNFKHKDSLHSFTSAFGPPNQRLGCFCTRQVSAEFLLTTFHNRDIRHSRFLLKLVATWKHWKPAIHPVRIRINDKDLFHGPLFLENVCAGWPSLYFALPLQYLRHGCNHLNIANLAGQRNTLIIHRAEILRQTDMVDFTIRACPDFVTRDEEFKIKLVLLQPHPDVRPLHQRR